MGGDKTGGGIVPASASAIGGMIHVVRGQQVMLVSDLAALYGAETGQLNRAATRNKGRFPEDFRFRPRGEVGALRCQIGILAGQGREIGRTYLPWAYTEQGIAMPSSVIRSETAVRVSVQIVRAFVEMRRFLAANAQVFERGEGAARGSPGRRARGCLPALGGIWLTRPSYRAAYVTATEQSGTVRDVNVRTLC